MDYLLAGTTSADGTGLAVKRPHYAAGAIRVTRRQREGIRTSCCAQANSARQVKAWRCTAGQSTIKIGRVCRKIRFLGHGRISQVGFDLGLMAALSIGCELGDGDGCQDTDDGNHNQQFNQCKA